MPRSLPVILLLLLTLFNLASCTAKKSEPIYYGKDSCSHCKMLIIDKRFGAEIVTAKGKVFKFDSIECMHNFEIAEHEKLGADFIRYLVNTDKQGELMPTENAYICEDPKIHSPMGKGYLTADSEEKLKLLSGKSCPIFRWNELANKLGK